VVLGLAEAAEAGLAGRLSVVTGGAAVLVAADRFVGVVGFEVGASGVSLNRLIIEAEVA
jgi:hypothetical protein